MRIVTFNIAYGTGCPKNMGSNILSAYRYLKTPRRSIDRISRFIRSYAPDIASLVEVDTGSFRTGYLNQAELLAQRLKSYQSSGIKYGLDSVGRKVPILRRQANAILTRLPAHEIRFHYFPVGFKRLVMELETPVLSVFLVHLALQGRIRQLQLKHLAKLIPPDRPCIVTGDFNTLQGSGELLPLCEQLNLHSVNETHRPTFPSWAPEKELDFILCSEHIIPERVLIPRIRFSDHLPIVFDFSLR